MKTKRKTSRTLIKIAFITLVIVGIQSCDTEIPEVDPTPPALTFQITGDGFNHSFDENSDFENIQLNLKNGITYTFTFIGTDTGGLEHAQIFVGGGDDYLQLLTPLPSPWRYRSLSPLQDVMEWFGDRNSPLTGAALTGDLRISGSNVATSLRFSIADFGGEHRRPNQIFKELYLYLGDHPTEIIDL